MTAELSQRAFLLKVDCLGNEEHTYIRTCFLFGVVYQLFPNN